MDKHSLFNCIKKVLKKSTVIDGLNQSVTLKGLFILQIDNLCIETETRKYSFRYTLGYMFSVIVISTFSFTNVTVFNIPIRTPCKIPCKIQKLNTAYWFIKIILKIKSLKAYLVLKAFNTCWKHFRSKKAFNSRLLQGCLPLELELKETTLRRRAF